MIVNVSVTPHARDPRSHGEAVRNNNEGTRELLESLQELLRSSWLDGCGEVNCDAAKIPIIRYEGSVVSGAGANSCRA